MWALLLSLPWRPFIKVLYWVIGGITLIIMFTGLTLMPVALFSTGRDDLFVTIFGTIMGSAGWFAIYCGMALLHRWIIGWWPFPMTYFIRWAKKIRLIS